MPKIIGSTYCKHCEKDVDVYSEDFGIGPYEFWGSKGYDSQIGFFCSECDEEIEDYDKINFIEEDYHEL